jgi:hypothetical protein
MLNCRGMDLTIHEIPVELDQALQAKAKAEGKSVNQVAIEALAQRAGMPAPAVIHHDLDWFIGGNFIDDETAKAIDDQRVIHPDDWK